MHMQRDNNAHNERKVALMRTSLMARSVMKLSCMNWHLLTGSDGKEDGCQS